MKIYEMPTVPKAKDPQPWSSFCQSREPFLCISYSKYRNTSRWQHVERVRKFEVCVHYRPKAGSWVLGHYLTLESAQKAAKEYSDRKMEATC